MVVTEVGRAEVVVVEVAHDDDDEDDDDDDDDNDDADDDDDDAEVEGSSQVGMLVRTTTGVPGLCMYVCR